MSVQWCACNGSAYKVFLAPRRHNCWLQDNWSIGHGECVQTGKGYRGRRGMGKTGNKGKSKAKVKNRAMQGNSPCTPSETTGRAGGGNKPLQEDWNCDNYLWASWAALVARYPLVLRSLCHTYHWPHTGCGMLFAQWSPKSLLLLNQHINPMK